MPPPPLFDLDGLNLDRTEISREDIYRRFLPHRHEFMLLGGIAHFDAEQARIVGYYDAQPEDWWVKGHIPGRPLLPGVLMLEMAAQTASVGITLLDEHRGAAKRPFVGFGGVSDCKFRDAVIPPARLHILCTEAENRPRRFISATQGWVGKSLVFEATITGMVMG
ncbi:MAG: beta-hydroxyacyl-ACP dehydratase [Phycisphaerales bacterium]|nr:beta-hydroxyacyl-ACP dehydratase [Phycisphaerales bacterium]